MTKCHLRAFASVYLIVLTGAVIYVAARSLLANIGSVTTLSPWQMAGLILKQTWVQLVAIVVIGRRLMMSPKNQR